MINCIVLKIGIRPEFQQIEPRENCNSLWNETDWVVLIYILRRLRISAVITIEKNKYMFFIELISLIHETYWF